MKASAARKLGCIDAVVFLVLWLSVLAASASEPWSDLFDDIVLLGAASGFVGWRGTVVLLRHQPKAVPIRCALLEGAALGAIFYFLVSVWLFYPLFDFTAMGASGDQIPILPSSFLLMGTAFFVGLGAGFGALNGLVLYCVLNRLLVRLFLALDTRAMPN
ncbi:hypothetical protein [Rhizobacter sp. Root1221]|uniref:hypothetical protein n=1 Tax=Rhizobacter sp. Root1221 TaxID=1736433 RepID=UPI0012F9559F|nr:hypothetical protein [Rhizobacter sp. Root1221]